MYCEGILIHNIWTRGREHLRYKTFRYHWFRPVLHNRCAAMHWSVMKPYQVCRREFVSFLAKMLFIFLQIDKPQPQHSQQISLAFWPEDLFFV